MLLQQQARGVRRNCQVRARAREAPLPRVCAQRSRAHTTGTAGARTARASRAPTAAVAAARVLQLRALAHRRSPLNDRAR